MKNILITGASRGIGKCLAENLAKDNYNILINYNNSETEAKELYKELKSKNCNVEIFKADVSKKEQVEEMVDYMLEKFGKIDVLINNAGISQIKLFTEILEQDWNKIINTNLNSVFFMTQSVLNKCMINQKSGCIINISSIWGIAGASCEVAYSTTKAGINGLTKALAKELGPSNIRVNAIAPGIIKTQMNNNLSKEEIDEIKKEIPLGKIGNPVDIYKCVKWLIEDEYTTGQIISPNGGWII
jgi:3-oxoacyl-[acyl-carrier protein] reductase